MAVDNYSLIRYLQANGTTSGEHLGEIFGVSRAAISKRMKLLDDVVERIPAKGYQLVSGRSFVSNEAVNALTMRFNDIEVTSVLSVGSTNSELMSQARAGAHSPALLVAELQTEGRGRRGKQWLQPCGTGLSFSLRWTFSGGFNILSGLSLSVGLWVASALDALGFSAELKWPNDIYLNGAKLGGVLVEVEGDANGPVTVIIGIGLNVTEAPTVEQAASCLGEVDKDELLVRVVGQCVQGLKEFEEMGFGPLRDRWLSRALWLNQPVTVVSGLSQRHGIYRGVTERGELCFEEDASEFVLSGGEISLRSNF